MMKTLQNAAIENFNPLCILTIMTFLKKIKMDHELPEADALIDI